MSDKHLLVKLDDKSFFTHTKNFRQLIEFGKTFGAEISVVQGKIEPLDLGDLAKQICTGMGYDKPEYTVLEVKLPSADSKTDDSRLIRAKYYIKNKLLCKGGISYQSLATKYPEVNEQTFNELINVIAQELEKSDCCLRKSGDCWFLRELWNADDIWSKWQWKA